MKTFIKFMFCHTSDKCNILLLLGVLLFLMSTCETEYIPPDSENNQSAVAKEGNFTLNIGFANFGESDSMHNLGSDSLSATRRMEPETNVIRVNDNELIFATLAEDPVGSTPAVKTKSFTAGAKIRVLAYAVTGSPTPTYTKAFDEEYSFSNKLSRTSGTGDIMLPQGTYKFIAYSYNNTSVTPVSPLLNIDTIIPDIDPVNDLIWGESVPTTVYDGPPLDTVKIKMVHKLSQVKLVAATPKDATPSITAFSNVTMPGYYFDLETFNGAITQKGPVQQNFDFPALPANPADTVKATTRTVYTAGDIPTVFHIGSMTVDGKTLNDFYATFAKTLKSGYSYTMTMSIGVSPNITDNVPAGVIPFVGAFWKHDQTGERLIRVPRLATGLIDSVWTAQVIEGRDWILLDTIMTTDPNVGWRSGANESAVENGNDFESNAARQLTTPTASIFVSGMVLPGGGSNQIYFRIGLKDQYTPTTTNPARYGVVLLTYGNNKYRHRIWIRQGEDPDYLMRPGDPNGAGTQVTGNRSSAVKFSPYNLTDPNKNTATTYAGAPNLGAKGGAFVDYPSKAGYHFQWNGNTKAFHPTNTITGWTARSGNTWNVSFETCPNGYRRPTDVFAAGLSEIRHSLWISGAGSVKENQDTNPENVVWGYYADGYFDRRQIVPAIVGPTTNYPTTLPRAVATPGAEVAYMGMLLYNKYNNASLFFPVTGFRTLNGSLDQAGKSGHGWSKTWSSASANAMQLAFDVDAAVSHTSFLTPDEGLAIRCVKPACVTITSVTVAPTQATIATGASTLLTATLVPAGAESAKDDAHYQWQRSFDGGVTWLDVVDSTSYQIYAKAVMEGITKYRVLATNDCSSQISSSVVDVTGTGPEPFNSNFVPYVGAFWQSNQIGERLIRIAGVGANYYGAWRATVLGSDISWIELDKVMTSDANVGWLPSANEANVQDMNNATNDATYRIPAGAGTSVVDGVLDGSNTDIYFRIGLKSTSATPRYGIVLLTYQDHNLSQRIFVRQGQTPDFAPGSTTGTKWGVYNLGNITNATTYPTRFVAYPSQGGFFYQFWGGATASPLHPINPESNPPGWIQNGTGLANATSSYCPSGYRMPSGGTGTTGDFGVLTSSGRSSTWGYYADGFFDRRKLNTGVISGMSEPSVGGRAVGLNLSNGADPKNEFVAYAGALIYNAADKKSLFFPSAGVRIISSAGRTNALGNWAAYWSGTQDAGSPNYTAWCWDVIVAGAVQSQNSRGNNAVPIRCVQ